MSNFNEHYQELQKRRLFSCLTSWKFYSVRRLEYQKQWSCVSGLNFLFRLLLDVTACPWRYWNPRLLSGAYLESKRHQSASLADRHSFLLWTRHLFIEVHYLSVRCRSFLFLSLGYQHVSTTSYRIASYFSVNNLILLYHALFDGFLFLQHFNSSK